jgi:5'-methylthioadenosine phosphorylase
MRKGVLFLCTGNSARSQMAEGLARLLLPPDVPVHSAGTQPVGVNPRAVAAMAEIGVDIAAQTSKLLATIDLKGLQLIVTLCDDAARSCPSVPGVAAEHWGLEDPAAATGSDAEIAAKFRAIRDRILGRLWALAQKLAPEPAIGIVGGSGFYDLPGVEDRTEVAVDTPFGPPSDHLFVGKLAGKRVVFLPRHGRGHKFLPHEVNYRANLYALKRLGVTRVLSISAVGSLREHIAPGHVVFPRQFIDRAMHRENTFFGGGAVAHVSLADPVCNSLAVLGAACARQEPGMVHDNGTYVCMDGPQFSTRAESHLYRAWGADIIGMTNGTEAKLAREAELCYATMAFPTDYDCWRTATEEVTIEEIIRVLHANVAKGQRIVTAALKQIDPLQACACRTTLDAGLMTPVDALPPAAQVRLAAILQRRVLAAAAAKA